jgi:hypothetical protein
MSKKMLIALIVGLLATTAYSQPDTLWTKTFGGSNTDKGQSVQQTTDGGYIITGFTQSYGAGGYDVWLIKTDASGIEQWSQTFGGSSDDHGNSVQQTSDGGYIIAGTTLSYGAGYYDVYLIKTDASGNEQWSQTFGGLEGDYGNSVQQTSDDGYIIAGETASYGAGTADVYLIKTDASGIEQWSQTWGGIWNDYGRSVQQTTDGGYIITGTTLSYGLGYDVWLIKTDASGQEQWSQTFGGFNYDDGYSVQLTIDGGYIIAGKTSSYGAGLLDVWLIKTDASGNEQWSQTFGGSVFDASRSVQQTSDGGYIIAGTTLSYGADSHDVWLIKTNALGQEQWSQTFGGSEQDQGKSVQQTTDGGYIVAGFTQSYGAGSSDAWLIRIASAGTPDVTVTLTPYGTPIYIPASGGTFDFNIEVANNGANPETFDIWTMATLPNGSEYGPIINVPDFTAPGSWSANRDRTQAVPSGAPAGMYTYDGYVGVYPDTVWYEDHFEFGKLAGDGGSTILGWACWGETFEEATQQPEVIPAEIYISSAYPNPFNPVTTLSFALPEASHVTLTVFDLQGRVIAELVNGLREAGIHEVTFDASQLASGLYFYRIEAGEFSAVEKMILMK